MQDPMNYKMRPVGGEIFALCLCFCYHKRCTNDDVTQQRKINFSG